MAQQHFYSRVPARASMFLRADGFDTFAKAKELTEEWIERELAPVCSYKPTKNESVAIRNGSLPPAYLYFFTKTERRMVESCISYIPRDYTGERSSYLIHSLILTEEEKSALLTGDARCILSPDNFVTDIAPFRITAANAEPLTEYPDVAYRAADAPPAAPLTEKYPEGVLKRLIFAMLLYAVGKGKPIYITLDVPLCDFSTTALSLMNALFRIFPSSIRAALPFVTYQSDYTKFPAFAIRFLPRDAMTVPTGRGFLFDMTTRLADGISDVLYRDNEALADFFCALTRDEPMREEFLRFYEHALQSDPAFAAEQSLKAVTSIVYLYRKFSGRFADKDILPNSDAVYDLLCRYEKYRVSLSSEDRIAILGCINRYLEAHTPIPKNIFGKITKLYPSEPAETKVAVMDILLDMIHTDIMRDKLFRFIASVYPEEPAEKRDKICDGLIRVFYGGFLQIPILNLLAQHFRDESLKTRNRILDKFILSIRTVAIQDHILGFFRSFFGELNEEQTEKILDMIYEMLPIGDTLAEKLVSFLNQTIPEKSEECRRAVAQKLLDLTLADRRKKVRPVLPLLTREEGFCRDTVVTALLGEWAGNRIFTEFLEHEIRGEIPAQIDRIIRLWQKHPYIGDEVARKLLAQARASIAADRKATVYTWIEAEATLRDALIKKYSAICDAFCNALQKDAILPRIIDRAEDTFLPALRADGPEFLLAYAKEHPDFAASAPCGTIADAIAALDAAKDGKPQEAALSALLAVGQRCEIPSRFFSFAIGRLRSLCGDPAVAPQTVGLLAALILAIGYEQDGTIPYRAAFDEIAGLHAGEITGKVAASAANVESLVCLAASCAALRACGLPDGIRDALVDGENGDGALSALLREILPSLSGGNRTAFAKALANLPDAPLAAFWRGVLEKVEKANRKNFFAKLFGR